jgi:hypothetical protein
MGIGSFGFEPLAVIKAFDFHDRGSNSGRSGLPSLAVDEKQPHVIPVQIHEIQNFIGMIFVEKLKAKSLYPLLKGGMVHISEM